MAFVLKKRITFEDESSDWKDCFFEFNVPSYSQVKNFQDIKADNEAVNKMVSFLQELFLAGKAFNGTETVDIKAEDLVELPILILMKCFDALAGSFDPKALAD